MIDLARVANNALVLMILGCIFYLIYQSRQGNKILDKFKTKIGGFTWGMKK